jgi:hypothetical protein
MMQYRAAPPMKQESQPGPVVAITRIFRKCRKTAQELWGQIPLFLEVSAGRMHVRPQSNVSRFTFPD